MKYGNRRSASRHGTVVSQPSAGYGTLMLASAPGGKLGLLACTLQAPHRRLPTAIAYLAGSFLALRYPSGVYSVPGGKFLGTNLREICTGIAKTGGVAGGKLYRTRREQLAYPAGTISVPGGK